MEIVLNQLFQPWKEGGGAYYTIGKKNGFKELSVRVQFFIEYSTLSLTLYTLH